MDPRLEGIIDRFGVNKGLTGNLPLLTEHFANYVILREEYFKANSVYPYESEINKELLEDINFGKNGTESIDGFFCVIENSKDIIHIESEPEEIVNFITAHKKAKIHVVLIQTKTSKFDTTNVSVLKLRLDEKSEEQKNWKLFFKFRAIIENLLKKMEDLHIRFSVIYYSGQEIDSNLLKQPNFVFKLDGLKKSMKECLWAGEVNVEFYDAQKLMEFYIIQSKAAEKVHKTIELHQMTNTITCGDKTEMRLGLIKIKQLKTILYDFDLKRAYQLYEFNVRHNLAETAPNKNMRSTLLNENENFKFPLFNNGITMVIDSMSRKGDSAIELKNIRIVNGCQTSHVVLGNCIDNSTYDEILIPLKMIATEDNNILSEITHASNHQNAIQNSNLHSLNKNIILLEAEYTEFNLVHRTELSSEKFYFERRQGQYASIDSNFVVDIPIQSKIFIASWFARPHIALQYKDKTLVDYNTLIENYEGKNLKNFCSLSIISGVLWCKIYKKIRTGNYEPARYHILCGVIFSVIQKHLREDYLKQDDTTKLSACFGKINEITASLLNLITNSGQLENEINKVIQIIDSESLKEALRPSIKGKIHYRKFYPASIMNKILDTLS